MGETQYKNAISSAEVSDTETDDDMLDLGEEVALVRTRSGVAEVDTRALAGGESQATNGARRRGSVSKKVAAWSDLPKKEQLIVITLTRLSEPLVQTSLQAYMFYQLKWFDPSLPDSVIAQQAGILHASFTAAQFLTAMLWGRVADSAWAGRKTVLLIGLCGTMISCLGSGFSRSFYQALFFRSLGGVMNGNTGVIRTMISEIVREKKFQSRAFLLLPMTFNVGVIIGPILGGILSDPAGSYPGVFGNVVFFQKFPYALPNLVSALILCFALAGIFFLLEETHDALREKKDYGRLLASKIAVMFRGNGRSTVAYTLLDSRDCSVGVERSSVEEPSTAKTVRRRYTQTLPFRRIFTRNVTMTLVAYFLFGFYLGTFNSLWFVFLSTPVYNPEKPDPPDFVPSMPFRFTGGLGMPPSSVGLAMAMLGTIGIMMQLFLYPRLSSRFGTVLSWRMCLCLFPITYAVLPFLSLVPSTTPPPSQKTGPAVWIAIGCVLFVQVVARTFALPAQTILVNNCSPHPSILGTVHGIGLSVNSFARTIGPVSGGWLYGIGLSHGLVGGVWWGLAGVALCGLVASFWVREGNGHEIWLEGDEED